MLGLEETTAATEPKVTGMFKLGVITDEITLDVERAVHVAKELSLDCIELRGCWNKNVKDLTDSEVQRIKRTARAVGSEVVCVASPLFKCSINDGKEVEEHLRFLPRLITITKLFDAEILRGFAFWSTRTPDQHWNKVIEKLRQAADLCRNEGVILALENEPATFVGTGREARSVLEKVGSKGLMLVWDPGNAFCAGEVPYPDGYLQARGHVVHMHLKDAVWDKDTGKARFVAVGSGAIDYLGQFRALIEDGYNGCVSIETHYLIQGDGEKSTRETCAGLRRVLKELGL